ncbi:hypothetical protein F5887DRAFT_625764 [Amanita rubescens]|nr:hypothetical protein F5887DRAFT_625764 [Amanita rubescens]
MLFLHAVLLFLLGTFALAIPVYPETSSFVAISRKEKLIDKSRIVGYWRTPVDRDDPTITNTRSRNEAAPINVMYINADGTVQLYRDEHAFKPDSNFLYQHTRWIRAEEELLKVSRLSRPNILTSYV